MSVAEFSDTLRKRIFDRFDSLSNKKSKEDYKKLVDSDRFRTRYEAAKRGASAVFDENSINALKQGLIRDIEDSVLRNATEIFLKSISTRGFVSYLRSTTYVQKLLENTDGEFRLESVPQATLRDEFLTYIEIQLAIFGLNPALEAAVYDHINSNVQSGHLAGVFTLRLKEALFLNFNDTGESYRDFQLDLGDGIDKKSSDTLERIIKVILDADYLTSNIVDKEHIFAEAVKTVLGDNPHLEIELQYKKDNEAAGKLLAQAGSSLNALIKAVSSQNTSRDSELTDGFRKLVVSLKPLAEVVLAKATELQNNPNSKDLGEMIAADARALSQLASDLVNTKGSPSMVESVAKNIANIIKNGKPLDKVTTTVKYSASKTSKVKEVEDVNKVLKKVGVALKQVQQETKKQNKISGKKQTHSNAISGKLNRMPSLASLQSFINSNLQNVIAANMGSGSEHSILNYRTGRFAASAKVESMSLSKQGMITAFYTYMKYPYQTFEPGFKQGSPASRNPKLLISKSVREILATKVDNKLRAQAL
jgi:hypothetical protein